MKNIKLRVNEIFYSIQGEGANAGMSAIFVRLAGCNMQCPFCDTKHETYKEMSIGEIIDEVNKYAPCYTIIWTGGEPTLQLTDEIMRYFSPFYNCIETNGTKCIPKQINYIACSPKVPVITLYQNFAKLDEIRYAIKTGDVLPDFRTLPRANHYFISPIDVSLENVNYCIKLIKENPEWKLSVQIHKLLNIQ